MVNFPNILTLRFCFDLGGLAGRGVRPGAGDQPEAGARDGEAGRQQGRGLPGQARAGDRRSNNYTELLAPLEQLRRGHAELAARHEQFSAEHVSAVERSRLYDQDKLDKARRTEDQMRTLVGEPKNPNKKAIINDGKLLLTMFQMRKWQ